MKKKGFIVKVMNWTRDHYDYYYDEYTGIIYKRRKDAFPELDEARDAGLEAYIETVFYN